MNFFFFLFLWWTSNGIGRNQCWIWSYSLGIIERKFRRFSLLLCAVFFLTLCASRLYLSYLFKHWYMQAITAGNIIFVCHKIVKNMLVQIVHKLWRLLFFSEHSPMALTSLTKVAIVFTKNHHADHIFNKLYWRCYIQPLDMSRDN